MKYCIIFIRILLIKDNAFKLVKNSRCMAIEYVCRWCGFILYKGDKPKSAEDVARYWGGKCPRCLSPISKIPHKIEVLPVRKPISESLKR